MKVSIMTKEGSEKGTVELPIQFNEPVRKDIIQRAVQALQNAVRQPYGSFPDAGKRSSAYLSKRRRKYRGTYGIGQSRTPRKILSRSGSRIYYVGAFAPQTVGGRQAHPPKSSKIWETKINVKENRKAIRSALAATMQKEIVKERGHKVPENYPFIISDEFESVKKTADLKKLLETLGFKDELKRASEKKIRSGKGKTRGRKYKKKKSMLFVTSKQCDLLSAAKNIPGSDITTVEYLNAELLAPGAQPGRLTLFTESAIKKLDETKLFTKDFKDFKSKNLGKNIGIIKSESGDASVSDSGESEKKVKKKTEKKEGKKKIKND